MTYDDTSVIQPNTTKDSVPGMVTNYIGSSSSSDDESAFLDALSTLDPALESGNEIQLINQAEGIFYEVSYHFHFIRYVENIPEMNSDITEIVDGMK